MLSSYMFTNHVTICLLIEIEMTIYLHIYRRVHDTYQRVQAKFASRAKFIFLVIITYIFYVTLIDSYHMIYSIIIVQTFIFLIIIIQQIKFYHLYKKYGSNMFFNSKSSIIYSYIYTIFK